MSENVRDLKARVMLYLDQHRGQRVFLSQMASDLNETGRRIQQTIAHIRTQNNYPIRTIVKGHTWEIAADNSPSPSEDNTTKYTEVTILRSGAVLLERQDGALFKAVLTEVA